MTDCVCVSKSVINEKAIDTGCSHATVANGYFPNSSLSHRHVVPDTNVLRMM